jgi:hypothetical protein
VIAETVDAKNHSFAIGGVHGEDGVLTHFDGVDPHAVDRPVGYRIERQPMETGALLGGRELGKSGHAFKAPS